MIGAKLFLTVRASNSAKETLGTQVYKTVQYGPLSYDKGISNRNKNITHEV